MGNKNSGRYPRKYDKTTALKAIGKPEQQFDLSKEERAVWNFIVDQHFGQGTIGAVDTPTIRQACKVWSILRKVEALVDADPLDKENRSAYRQYLSLWLQITDRLGMTPKARAALRGVKKDGDEAEDTLKIFTTGTDG